MTGDNSTDGAVYGVWFHAGGRQHKATKGFINEAAAEAHANLLREADIVTGVSVLEYHDPDYKRQRLGEEKKRAEW